MDYEPVSRYMDRTLFSERFERGPSSRLGNPEQSEDDATLEAASAISERLFEHRLTDAEKKVTGPVVHYTVGATGGIVYGIAAEFLPKTTAGFGLP
jgi:hypothetical protein